MERPAVLALLATLSFVPAFLFLLVARARERNGREPFAAVLGVFLHGATLGVGMAILLSVAGSRLVGAGLLLTAVLVVPVVEELTKGLGLGWVRRHVDELEDGIVYGVAAGVGFAATETFLYGLLQLGEASVAGAVATVGVRNVSSLLLHASSSALVGFGYARMRLVGGPASLVACYLIAVGLHAAYNALVLVAGWAGFAAAVAIVVACIVALMAMLRRLDRGVPPVPGSL